jgi:hypothetical protein
MGWNLGANSIRDAEDEAGHCQDLVRNRGRPRTRTLGLGQTLVLFETQCSSVLFLEVI